MVFIVVFLIIATVVVGLNMHDNANLKKIENHLKEKDCTNLVYGRGSYKALCEDKIAVIQNSFTIEFENNSKDFNYTDIKNIDVKKLDIILNDDYYLQFKHKEELDKFYDELKKRIKN